MAIEIYLSGVVTDGQVRRYVMKTSACMVCIIYFFLFWMAILLQEESDNARFSSRHTRM